MNYKEKISYKAETYDFLMLLLLIHISIYLKNMDIELFSILEIIILHIIQCIIYISFVKINSWLQSSSSIMFYV